MEKKRITKIKQARKRKGYTQHYVCDLVNTQRRLRGETKLFQVSHLSKIEGARIIPGSLVLRDLAEAYRLPMDDLIGFVGAKSYYRRDQYGDDELIDNG